MDDFPVPTANPQKSRCSVLFLDPERAEVYEGIKTGKLKLPSHVDKNIIFSDDEEEETVIPNIKANVSKPNVPVKEKDGRDKTPVFKGRVTDPATEAKVHQIVSSTLKKKSRESMGTNLDGKPPYLQNKFAASYSHGKSFPATYRNDYSARKFQNKENVPEFIKSSKQNLMCRPEFQVFPKEDIVTVNQHKYQILSELGSGGSSVVYRALDLQTFNSVALKKVSFKDTDQEMIDGYRQEIAHLESMRGSSHVIDMHQYQYIPDGLIIVLELGDMDLARYISEQKGNLCPVTIRYLWSQMLRCVQSIHEKGIVHSDLKPPNFVMVGVKVKLIDFGIATSVPEDATSALRERYVGTINYMSPEASMQHSVDGQTGVFFKVKASSDVWSLGCILYSLVYGRTPFQHIRHMVQKIRAISDPNHVIAFPPIDQPQLMEVMSLCLRRDPKERPSVQQLLQHPYVTGKEEDWIRQARSLSSEKQQYLHKYIQKLAES